jgi:hypothetical protein
MQNRSVGDMNGGRRPESIWLMPWHWGREELRRIAVWALAIALIVSSVAPTVLPTIASGVGHLCWLGWFSLFRMIETLIG